MFALYLFLGAWSLLALNFVGYPLALAWRARSRREREIAPPAESPPITILLPVYNEAGNIEGKLANLASLRRPSRVRVLAVDGRSTDRTTERLEAFAAAHPEWSLQILQAKERGKIPQLNEALETIDPGDIVVVTDADARIETPDALPIAVAHLLSSSRVGVVGAWVDPSAEGVVPAERAAWMRENHIRYRERLAGSSSIVVAPFYAFRRSLLDCFPRDCVADDVHVSFRAHREGLEVRYLTDVRVTELRAPAKLSQLFRHKLRKANAYCREIRRFLPRVFSFSGQARLLLLVKAFQFFVLPPATVLAGLGALLLGIENRVPLVAAWAFGVWLLGRAVGKMLPKSPLPSAAPRSPGLAKLAYLAVAFACLLINWALFPFWRQTSRYPRVLGRSAPIPSEKRRNRA